MPDIRPVAELGLLEDPAEQLVGQGPVGVLLHVDVDVGAALAGRAEDRPQPPADALDRRLGVDRLEVSGQARQLEREVDARDRAVSDRGRSAGPRARLAAVRPGRESASGRSAGTSRPRPR